MKNLIFIGSILVMLLILRSQVNSEETNIVNRPINTATAKDKDRILTPSSIGITKTPLTTIEETQTLGIINQVKLAEKQKPFTEFDNILEEIHQSNFSAQPVEGNDREEPTTSADTYVTVEVFVHRTWYDPRLCLMTLNPEETVKELAPDWYRIPALEYGRQTGSYPNLSLNCSSIEGWSSLGGGRNINSGCSGGSCYSVSGACPTEIALEQVGDRIMITGHQVVFDDIAKPILCYDTGSEVTMLPPLITADGECIPAFDVDILHDVRSGPTPWQGKDVYAKLVINKAAFDSIEGVLYDNCPNRSLLLEN